MDLTFPCGCVFSFTLKVDSLGLLSSDDIRGSGYLAWCPMHKAAPEMRDLLRRFAAMVANKGDVQRARKLLEEMGR